MGEQLERLVGVALVAPDSFANLTIRQTPRNHQAEQLRHEFGVIGHGPHGARLAQQLLEHVQTWDHEWRYRR
ncbi:hypothetical protein [Nonomuraea sp. KM88]|uniref:hypothetical protein n=1 Tax=Nonomuraea sp. KM88 TaxID=3457427 RepID=UPI003FCD1347